MTELASSRFALPYLALAQVQKEVTHNEALALIDLLLHPVCEGTLDDPSALLPEPGQCWIVGADAAGAWGGHANQLAGWTEGGWRFAVPVEAMSMFDRSTGGSLTFRDGLWSAPESILLPSGGSVIDREARDSFTALVTALERAGILLATIS